MTNARKSVTYLEYVDFSHRLALAKRHAKYLESEFEFFQGSFHFAGEEIHSLAFLKSDDHVGRPFFDFAHHLEYVEFFG